MGVSDVDSASLGWDNYSVEMAIKVSAREDTGSPWGEPYRGRIHMWDHRTTHGHLAQHKGWPWATHECWTWRLVPPPHLTAEGPGGNFNSVRCRELNWEATKCTYPVRRGKWHSKRDWHWAGSSITGHPRQVHGRTPALYGDYKILQAYEVSPRPVALQCLLSRRPAPKPKRKQTPLVECALTPRGHSKHRAW